MKRLAWAVMLAGCASAPSSHVRSAPATELEVPKMPGGASAPIAVAPAPARRDVAAGKCEVDEVGSAAPPLALGLQAGAVNLVYWWATWCAPCQADFPRYEELYQRYRDRGFNIIALAVDDEATGIDSFAKQHNAHFDVVWDKDHEDAKCWVVRTLPSAMLVDRNGVVRFIHEGSATGDHEKLGDEIESLL